MSRLRARIRFSKQGDLRFIGHRDLMRCMERIFRRVGMPLGFSEGFHPKPRMTFPLALAVGIEGLDEVMEVELSEPADAGDLHRRLSPEAPKGLSFRSVDMLPEGSRKVRVQGVAYEVPIPSAHQDGIEERIERLLAAESCMVERGRGRPPIDLRPLVTHLAFTGQLLEMRLRVSQQGSVGPREVLAALGLSDVESEGVRLCRTGVELVA